MVGYDRKRGRPGVRGVMCLVIPKGDGMRYKKLLAIAAGLLLCVGGDVWGEKYTVKYVELVTEPGGRYGDPKGGIYDDYIVKKLLLLGQDNTVIPKKFSWITTEIDADLANLDNALVTVEDPAVYYGKRVILRKMVDQNVVYVIFGRDALQKGASIKSDQLGTINPENNFLRDVLCKKFTCDNTLVDFLDRTENNDTYINIAIDDALDLAVAAIKKSGEIVPAAKTWEVHKASRKKQLLEKKEPEKPADDPKKDIEKKGDIGADEPETKMVKAIAVTVNPLDNDFFLFVVADLNKKDIIFTAMEGPLNKEKENAALLDPTEIDNYYYLYFHTDPKNPIKQEINLSKEPKMAAYPINSKTISTLTKSKDNNYLIPNFASIPIEGDKSLLKGHTEAYVDGKIVDWLEKVNWQPGTVWFLKNMALIKDAAIKKFKELGGKVESDTGDIESNPDKGATSTSTTGTTDPTKKPPKKKTDKGTTSTTGPVKTLGGTDKDLDNLTRALYKLAQ